MDKKKEIVFHRPVGVQRSTQFWVQDETPTVYLTCTFNNCFTQQNPAFDDAEVKFNEENSDC